MKKEAYSKINPIKFGLSAGAVMALIVLLVTWISMAQVLEEYSLIITLIHEVYGGMGYSAIFVGSLLGAIYTFIDTFILTWVFAIFYNWLIRNELSELNPLPKIEEFTSS